jgi:ribosomal protein S18 acetylase RimI-like enzyme
VKQLLDNPVYHSLLTGDHHLGQGTANVRYFYEEVSPFAGFDQGYASGFADLHHLLPAGRRILYASRNTISQPKGWTMQHGIQGLQFVFDTARSLSPPPFHPVPLEEQHVPQMMELAALTKPGPFGPQTIAFGHYHGVFANGKLVAMTGQRLHLPPYTEVSAVCTHPDHLGKGYAGALVQHQLGLILEQGQVPFLHVRADNERAIALYERLGFVASGPMNFYFLKREE